jgi:CRISPR-associated protein Cas2
MTVIICHDVPDAIRGLLKRWFIEPRPNVFVGTINRRTRDKTLEYIKRNAPGITMLIISSDPNCQGFKIESHQ